MPRSETDLNPVSHITADAIGQPGERVFYIQGWRHDDPQPITILLEKIQLQSLAAGVDQLLAQLNKEHPHLPEASGEYEEAKMHITPPVDPLFRAGDIGLGYDADHDLVIIFLSEILAEGEDAEEAEVVRYWCTRTQALRLARWSGEVVKHGRPLCPQCGQPMEPEGHFCPKKNGHRH